MFPARKPGGDGNLAQLERRKMVKSPKSPASRCYRVSPVCGLKSAQTELKGRETKGSRGGYIDP